MVADLDWKATWQANLLMDWHQTRYFAEHGIEELNVLWKDMVKRKDYTLLGAAWTVASVFDDQVIGRWKSGYLLLAVKQIIVVGLNARRHGVGFPVVVVRF